MKLEVGKEYVTRDRKKVRIICDNRRTEYGDSFVGLIGYNEYEVGCFYWPNGKVSKIRDVDPLDIVGPWVEPKPKQVIKLRRALIQHVPSGLYEGVLVDPAHISNLYGQFIKWLDDESEAIEVEL